MRNFTLEKGFKILIFMIDLIFLAIFYLSLYINLNMMFTLGVGFLLIFLTIYIYFIDFNRRFLPLFSIIIVIILVRFYPIALGLPLGMDSLRDVTFDYVVMNSGYFIEYDHIPTYYIWFPSNYIIPIFFSLISGVGMTYAHFLSLSVIMSVASILFLIILNKVSFGGKRLGYLAMLIYAVMPTLATWGYWVIPMGLSMVYSLYSLTLFILYLYRFEKNLVNYILSLIFIFLSIMTHGMIGVVSIAFFGILGLLFLRNYRGISAISGSYFTISIIFSISYWRAIGFLDYVQKRIYNIFHRLINIKPDVLSWFKLQGSKTIVIPNQITSSSSIPSNYPVIINFNPDTYPWYYLLPRWLWSSLIVIIPTAILLYLLFKRDHNIDKIIISIGLYGLLLSFTTFTFLLFNIMGSPERYIGSPATIYTILFIPMFLLLKPVLTRNSFRGITLVLLSVLLISSLLDPRTSFYTNPFEGDRVTFTPVERSAAYYLISRYVDNEVIITDFSLMSSYMRYLGVVNERQLNILFGPISPALKSHLGKHDWMLLLRKYSIESQFIWRLNFRYDPSMINKPFYSGNLVYSNMDSYIFKAF